MTKERFDYLRDESNEERLSMGELIEIESEFDKIPDNELPDLRENAVASDMLDTIEARGSFDSKE